MTSCKACNEPCLKSVAAHPSSFHIPQGTSQSLSPHTLGIPFLLWFPEKYAFLLLFPSFCLLLPGSACCFSSTRLHLNIVLSLNFNFRP